MFTRCAPWPGKRKATGSAASAVAGRRRARPAHPTSRSAMASSRLVATIARRWSNGAGRPGACTPTSASAMSRFGREVRRAASPPRGRGRRRSAPRARAAARARLRRRRGRRCLLEHDVGVRAADAERAHAGAARPVVLRPGRQRRVDEERRAREIELGIRRLEVERRRKRLVMERERRLDQARDAGGGVEVADVGLDRAERAVARLVGHRRNAWVRPAISMGSPSAVPVPCAST